MTTTTFAISRPVRAEKAIKEMTPAQRARYTVHWFLTGQRPWRRA